MIYPRAQSISVFSSLVTNGSLSVRVCKALLVFQFCVLLVLSVFWTSIASVAGENPNDRIAYAYKMAGDVNRMRLVVRFDSDPELNWFLLRGPHRLVIDMPRTRFGFSEDAVRSRGMVSGVRYGLVDQQRSRMIVTMDAPFEVEHSRIVKNENTPGFRAIFDVISVSNDRFSQLLDNQMQITAATSAPKSDRLGKTSNSSRPFTVVIDPGHGGIDGGARGPSGTIEKSVTLEVARELKKTLEEYENMKVFLTRDADFFLRLDERVRIARQYEADLFVSLHADKVRQKYVRGATVYTLSEKASDAVSHQLAESENKADAIAGFELEGESEKVADILIDLVHRETQTFSIKLARKLVSAMSNSVEMINNPHRSAGFRVLRAHDIPSALIELGYLSNARDEKLMNDRAWRRDVSVAMAKALNEYREKVVSVGNR